MLFSLFFFVAYATPLESYYALIYKAEQMIGKNKFNKACTDYRKAFSLKIFFYADLRNAFKCAVLAGNRKMIVYFWRIIKQYPELVYTLRENKELMEADNNFVKNELLSYSEKKQLKNWKKKLTQFELSIKPPGIAVLIITIKSV